MTGKIIVVISQPRTGGSLVMHALNSYDPILNLYEFFPRSDMDFDKEHDYSNAKNAVSLMTSLETDNTIVCMKIQSYQLLNLGYNEIDKILGLPHVEVILLERNKLSAWISTEQAKKTSQYSKCNTDEVLVKFDLHDFLAYYKRCTNFYKFIREKLQYLDKNYLEMSYEKDLEEFSYDKFHALIDPWLESRGIVLGKKHQEMVFTKQRTVPIEQCISNYYDQGKTLIEFFRNKK
jgi:hypothetical protein